MIILAACNMSVFAQDTTGRTKGYRNEFGIDASGFFKQFVNLNYQQYNPYYSPTYYLTYRRHFKNSNLRIGIGGEYKYADQPTGMYGNTTTYTNTDLAADIRIGYEMFSNINRRWQVFYGVDARPSISYNKNENQYWNNPSAGYVNGMVTVAQTYGIAPLLGFRFRITERFSLLTESSLSINFFKQSSTQFFNPVSNQYSPKPDVRSRTTKVYSSLTQPVSLFVAFDI